MRRSSHWDRACGAKADESHRSNCSTVRAANTSFILVNAKGRAVPLPFHTSHVSGPFATIYGFSDRGAVSYKSDGDVVTRTAWAHEFGLKVITEAEYMEKQS